MCQLFAGAQLEPHKLADHSAAQSTDLLGWPAGSGALERHGLWPWLCAIRGTHRRLLWPGSQLRRWLSHNGLLSRPGSRSRRLPVCSSLRLSKRSLRIRQGGSRAAGRHRGVREVSLSQSILKLIYLESIICSAPLEKPRYNDLIVLMERAAYDGFRGASCNTTQSCDGLL